MATNSAFLKTWRYFKLEEISSFWISWFGLEISILKNGHYFGQNLLKIWKKMYQRIDFHFSTMPLKMKLGKRAFDITNFEHFPLYLDKMYLPLTFSRSHKWRNKFIPYNSCEINMFLPQNVIFHDAEHV